MSGLGTAQSSLAIGFCFPIITGILVALRFLTRRSQKADIGIDDWLTIPAWLCVTGNCLTILIGVFLNIFATSASGPADGPDDVSPQDRLVAQITAAMVILLVYGNVLIKFSICFFYRRIFVGRTFNICNWILIGLTALYLVVGHVSIFFFCGVHVREDFEGGWAVCDPWGAKIQLGAFAFDAFVDFLILILPLFMVSKLHLDFKHKIGVMVVFLLGGLAFVASLLNAIITIVILTNPNAAEGGTAENFYQGSTYLFANWPALEIGVGLIACNIPTLSFRLMNYIPQCIRTTFQISWSGIRNAAAVLTLRSGGSGRRGSHTINRNTSVHKDPSRAVSVGSDGIPLKRSYPFLPGSLRHKPSSDVELDNVPNIRNGGIGTTREREEGYNA